VFKLTPNGTTWIESVLHSFMGANDGANPDSRPIVDPNTGALYGTTQFGGTNNGGTVYMVRRRPQRFSAKHTPAQYEPRCRSGADK